MAVIFCEFFTGVVGTEDTRVIRIADHMLDTPELDDELYSCAVDNAMSFGIELCDEFCQDEDCENEHPGDGHIDFFYEIYDSEKHDGQLCSPWEIEDWT